MCPLCIPNQGAESESQRSGGPEQQSEWSEEVRYSGPAGEPVELLLSAGSTHPPAQHKRSPHW